MNDTLNKFIANCKKPFAEARVPPREIYTDSEFFALEKQQIFLKDWYMIGRAGEIPAAGDYLALDVVDHPVLVIRQEDGSIRAYANVCLHRYARLLTGKGNSKRFSCPYHGWTYDHGGSLVAVPYMEQMQDFSCEGKQLHELLCEIWHGFVFVSINPVAVPLQERLDGFEKEISAFDLQSYQDLYFESDEFHCNWKILMENFNESYHLYHAHRKTAGKDTPTELAQTGHSDGHSYIVHYTPFSTDAHEGTRDHDNFEVIAGLLPNGLAAIYEESLLWMCLQPVDAGYVKLRWGTSFSPEFIAAGGNTVEYHEYNQQVNNEDRLVTEAVQAGARFSNDYAGVFHPLEQQVFQFHCYIANKLK